MRRLYGIQAIVFLLLAAFAPLLTACSSDDYINTIPANSIAVVSVDMSKAVGQNNDNARQASLIKALLKVDDISGCGIDITSKLYFFESVEGNLGLAAKVSDSGNLEKWLKKLAESGYCASVTERGDCRFCTIKDSWVAGFNSTAIVIMGPVIAAQIPAMQQQIIKYMEQDEDDGLKSSPFFDRLDSISAPVAMVAQAAALPDKLSAPFTLGAPKDADASQIIVAAGMSKDSNGCLEISGETFSFNKAVDKALQSSLKTLRPISKKYLSSMSSDDALGAFLNVDGKQFIELLHASKSFQVLLAGINAAIDMDNIVKSVDGDMAIVMPQYSENNTSIRMSAQLGDKGFLADVPYWKQSCPKGGRIDDMGKDSYCYKDGSMSYVFGVTNDLQYYSGSTPKQAALSIGAAAKPLPQAVINMIAGKRLCMVFNIRALLSGNNEAKAFLPLLSPLLGNVNTIVYSLK